MSYEEGDIVGDVLHEFPSRDPRYLIERIYHYRHQEFHHFANWAQARDRPNTWIRGMTYAFHEEWMPAFRKLMEKPAG